MRTAPVGYHHAIEAPLALQYVVEQPLVVAVVLILVHVVGTHYAPYSGLGYGSLEGRKINFVERTVVNYDVYLMPVFLVVVESEVLNAGCHAL